MKRAVFAGSFDPFTLGHKDIAERASKLFDELIIAVAADNCKNSQSLQARKEIVEASLDVKNIRVVPFEGLLTDFMKNADASVLVRGVRSSTDLDYERSLMGVYRSLYPEVEVILLPARPELLHISSTVVRELCKMNVSLGGYVDAKAEKYVRGLYASRD